MAAWVECGRPRPPWELEAAPWVLVCGKNSRRHTHPRPPRTKCTACMGHTHTSRLYVLSSNHRKGPIICYRVPEYCEPRAPLSTKSYYRRFDRDVTQPSSGCVRGDVTEIGLVLGAEVHRGASLAHDPQARSIGPSSFSVAQQAASTWPHGPLSSPEIGFVCENDYNFMNTETRAFLGLSSSGAEWERISAFLPINPNHRFGE